MVAIKHLVSSLFASAAGRTSVLQQLESIRGALTHCDISGDLARLNLAPIHNAITPPQNITPTFVGLAFGVQNYTCTQSNNFTLVGAVAELFDVSCSVNSTAFVTNQVPLFAQWNATEDTSIQEFIKAEHILNPPDILAQHYFVTNPTTGQGVSPKWDFTSSGHPALAGNASAFIVARGKDNIPAPHAATDIAWLQVVNIGGDAGGAVADVVIRSDTVGGQPPASCVFGQSQDISVKYTSKYWFFGGAFGPQ
ncbi:hypothetical protein PHLGIDRAFT_19995 [Phlebiopsis gigantea 11061_1 CR5-6]|uniref:Malate dehydrogenase n=1 Tax=Phlebiopsis gigantea (strain 11061_1 CR5-6) TaxID=745531 RepID=A0A0C3RU22_PHLG1|nr:hypothetical protein PHLGIDRAFT_19995 [Phlebiopsis gigantea 11061_1 CR5-6]